jgi:CRISPR-associated endonuclease Cas1
MKYYSYWYRLKFKALRRITHLPLYTGVHWSAFFRVELKRYTTLPMAKLEFNVIPINCSRYLDQGEIVYLIIATNQQGKSVLQQWLSESENLSEIADKAEHFVLHHTIELLEYEIFQFNPEPDFEFAVEEIKELTMIFSSPLRLKRINKDDGRFFDPFHFDLQEFITRQAHSLDLPAPKADCLKISKISFIWLDIAYKKTLGGIIGGLVLKGCFSQELLKLLHWGQFCGVGKNRSFGFGFYTIKEFPHPVFNISRSKSGLLSFSSLRSRLLEMSEKNEQGTDMTAYDLLENPEYLSKLSRQITTYCYNPGEPVWFKIKKKKGGFRKIAAYPQKDKLVLSILTNYLDGVLEALITSNCYSYRKGYSYHLAASALKKEFDFGFSWGIKLDIADFFETLAIDKILLLFSALNLEPEITFLIQSYFKNSLIQGNTLSPLLSNFAMLAFDRWFRNQKKLKLIRYADDLVIIGRDCDKTIILTQIKFILSCLGLSINENKYEEFVQTDSLNFLGYSISQTHIHTIPKIAAEDEDPQWLPFPKLCTAKSKPLYLSFTINYAHTTGNKIYIKSKDSILTVLWKDINRILIMGKPRLSGGIIYRAIQEQVPIHFLTVHGRPLGGYYHYIRIKEAKRLFNSDEFYSFDEFSLDFAREIAFTKIINQYRQLKKRNISVPQLTDIANSLAECDNIEAIRGKEGYAAKTYFQHFRTLVEPFPFESRTYHPPQGPVNVLLSLGYSIIYRRFSEALRANGIDPFCGIFHQGRGNHEALASDLVECYRFLIDRIVLALINKKLITQNNFYQVAYSNYLRLDSEGFRAFIRYFENTMKTEIKIKGRTFSYEVWLDKTVLSLKNALLLGTTFKSYRSL